MLEAIFAAVATHFWTTARPRQAAGWAMAALLMLALDLSLYANARPVPVAALACGAVWIHRHRALSAWGFRLALLTICLVADGALNEGPFNAVRDFGRGFAAGWEAGGRR